MRNCFDDPLDDGGSSSRLNALGFFVKVVIPAFKMNQLERAIFDSIAKAAREAAHKDLTELMQIAPGSIDESDAHAASEAFSIETSRIMASKREGLK